MHKAALLFAIVLACSPNAVDSVGSNGSALHTGTPVVPVTQPAWPGFWNTETAAGGLTGANCGPAGGQCASNVVTVFETNLGADGETVGWVNQVGSGPPSPPNLFPGSNHRPHVAWVGVNPNGSWNDPTFVAVYSTADDSAVFAVVSTDGGNSWGPPQLVASAGAAPAWVSSVELATDPIGNGPQGACTGFNNPRYFYVFWTVSSTVYPGGPQYQAGNRFHVVGNAIQPDGGNYQFWQLGSPFNPDTLAVTVNQAQDCSRYFAAVMSNEPTNEPPCPNPNVANIQWQFLYLDPRVGLPIAVNATDSDPSSPRCVGSVPNHTRAAITRITDSSVAFAYSKSTPRGLRVNAFETVPVPNTNLSTAGGNPNFTSAWCVCNPNGNNGCSWTDQPQCAALGGACDMNPGFCTFFNPPQSGWPATGNGHVWVEPVDQIQVDHLDSVMATMPRDWGLVALTWLDNRDDPAHTMFGSIWGTSSNAVFVDAFWTPLEVVPYAPLIPQQFQASYMGLATWSMQPLDYYGSSYSVNTLWLQHDYVN